MKTFLFLFAILFIFVSCDSDTDTKDDDKKGCITNTECDKGFKCDLDTNKCVESLVDELTSIEVDFTDAGEVKVLDIILGEETILKAYGIYNNDEDNTDNITNDVRWFLKNKKEDDGNIGNFEPDISNAQQKFIATKVGSTEVYCRKSGVESEHLTINVKEAVIESITMSTPKDTIYLYESLNLSVIGILEGGHQIDLSNDVTYYSDPAGIEANGNKVSFTATGAYQVWSKKGDIESNKIDIIVEENIVEAIRLFYDQSFVLNTPETLKIKEMYKGGGEHLLESSEDITWEVKIITVEGEGDDAHDVENDATDADYTLDGFTLTLKTANKFKVIASKVYGEDTFTADSTIDLR